MVVSITVITSCIHASDHIPTRSNRSGKVKPGWNDNVQLLKSEALSCHKLWKCNGCPRDGYFAEMRRVTRAIDTIELLDILIDMLKPLE